MKLLNDAVLCSLQLLPPHFFVWMKNDPRALSILSIFIHSKGRCHMILLFCYSYWKADVGNYLEICMDRAGLVLPLGVVGVRDYKPLTIKSFYVMKC
jgi:hypothetical protein